jgi:hypothetical protein
MDIIDYISMNTYTKGLLIGTALLALTGCGSTPEALGEHQFRVTVSNVSADAALSDSVYMLHKAEANLNYKNKIAPTEFGSLAEDGNVEEYKAYLEALPGVAQVIVVKGKLKSGDTEEFIITLPEEDTDHTLYGMSGVTKLLGEDDTYIMINNLALPDDKDRTANGRNMDAGLITDGEDLVQAENADVIKELDQTLLQIHISKQ